MRLEELPPAALAGQELHTVSGTPRLQYTAPFLELAARFLLDIAGPGARLSVLAALDRHGPVAAIPLLRTSPRPGPRPFPLDLQDHFFGLWIRNLHSPDRHLRARALASRGLQALLRLANPSFQRGIVLHAPLSPVSEALITPRIPTGEALAALSALLRQTRHIAAAEGRCVFLPRVDRRHAPAWGDALSGFTRVGSYANAEFSLCTTIARRTRQMIRRNARQMQAAAVTVEITSAAPPGFPFGPLFEETARRHRDPSPHLGDPFFRELGARLSPRVRFLCARRGAHPLGFVAVLEQGTTWEAFKCGAHREPAGGPPVYLHLVYGELRELAAAEGVSRVDLGPGELPVKRHYGASPVAMDSFVALPPGFRGAPALLAYLRAVGQGIAAHEGHVASVATTPK